MILYLGHLHLDSTRKPIMQMHFSIGEVSNVTGEAKATVWMDQTVNLSTGDPVFQGDTVETTGAGVIGLVFLDKTTSLSEGGKMVLDELVYDPATGTGSMAVDMVEGRQFCEWRNS